MNAMNRIMVAVGFNGYADEVGGLYAGMDLKANY